MEIYPNEKKKKHKFNSDTTQNQMVEPITYPSAELMLSVCSEDYQRTQENYNKIYEKINIALVFSGVVLTIMLNNLDFYTAEQLTSTLKVWQLMLSIIELLCSIVSIILILVSTIWLLILLHGRTVVAFKSEDIIDKEIYKEKSEYAAVWVMDKYTQVVGKMRVVIEKKTKIF